MRECGNAGADGDADAADVPGVFDLADVDAGSYLNVEILDSAGDFLSAAHRTGWPIEGGEESIAHGFYFPSAESG